MPNAFTIDLEDWFCSHNLAGIIKPEQWHLQESRVERNTFVMLEMLQAYKTKATFFVLGWVAERFPELIKCIHGEGHEIGSHSYWHRQLIHLSPPAFEADLLQSIDVIENITGKKPAGFRAPAFSITPNSRWAFDVLQRCGIAYDSSVYPFATHPDYGYPGAPLGPYYAGNQLLELPMSCAVVGGKRIPCSGGAYLRFYPYPLFHWLTQQVQKQQRPYVFHIHPWELDAQGPKVQLPLSKSIRHYYNVKATAHKIERLLQATQFTTVKNCILQHASQVTFA